MPKNQPYRPTFGSISTGTMRSEDLIPAFANELSRCLKGDVNPISEGLVEEAKEIDYDSSEADDLVNDLSDALNEYAPPYGYFGAHPDDGTDYGFWLCEDFEQMILDDGGIKVNDLAEIPPDHNNNALVVNDHGNCTLYSCCPGYEPQEIWSIV